MPTTPTGVGRLLASLVALTLALVLTPGAAAQGARTRAQLSAGLAKLGAEVRLEVTVEGTEDASLAALPEVDGIEVLGVAGPRRSSFTTMVGGRRYTKTSVSWSIHLRPAAEGSYTMGDVGVQVDGKVVPVAVEPGTLKVVRDTEGESLGYFELVDLPQRVYEGQPFHLDLRFGWDQDLAVTTASLSLPWWSSLSGILEVRDQPRDATQTWLPLSVNGSGRIEVQRLGNRTVGGKPFEQLQLRRRLMATRPGTIEFAQSAFEFGQLGARSPIGASRPAREFFAILQPFTIEVVRVPEAGRPFEWTGAVGPLEVAREVDRRDLLVGDVVTLELEWTGDANLEFFDLPDLSRLERFSGWQVLGVDDRPDGLTRRAAVELRVLSPEVTEVPGVPLWTFDTTTEAYRLVESDPVPVRVTLPEDAVLEGTNAVLPDGEDLLDIDSHPRPGDDPAAPPAGWVLGSALLLPLLWVAGRRAVRRHGDPAAPVERRRRAALRSLERDLAGARDASAQREALWTFLGARTRERPEAWVGRAREDFHGPGGEPLDDGLAADLEARLAELDAAVYAGDDRPLEPGVLQDLARRLAGGGL